MVTVVWFLYSVVYNGIEQLIEETHKIKRHEEHPLEETLEDESQSLSQPYNLESRMTDLADRVITTIEQGLKVCVYILKYIAYTMYKYILYVCM